MSKHSTINNQYTNLSVELFSSFYTHKFIIENSQLKMLDIHESINDETTCVMEFADINKWVHRLPLIGGEIVRIKFSIGSEDEEFNQSEFDYTFIVEKVLNYQKDSDEIPILSGNEYITLDMTEINYFLIKNSYFRNGIQNIQNLSLKTLLEKITYNVKNNVGSPVQFDFGAATAPSMPELENFTVPMNWNVYEIIKYILNRTTSTESGFQFFYDRINKKFVVSSIDSLLRFETFVPDTKNTFIHSVDSDFYNTLHSWIITKINDFEKLSDESIIKVNLISLNNRNKKLIVKNHKMTDISKSSVSTTLMPLKYYDSITPVNKIFNSFTNNALTVFKNYYQESTFGSQELIVFVKARDTNMVGNKISLVIPFDDKSLNDMLSGVWLITKSITKIVNNQVFQQLCLNRNGTILTNDKDVIRNSTVSKKG